METSQYRRGRGSTRADDVCTLLPEAEEWPQEGVGVGELGLALDGAQTGRAPVGVHGGVQPVILREARQSNGMERGRLNPRTETTTTKRLCGMT